MSDLSRVLGLSKGTVHLLARTLENEGFLEREPGTGKYRLGPAVCVLAAAAQRDLRLAAREPMRRLYSDTSFPVYLATFLAGRAVVVEKAAPTLSFLPVLDVGAVVPLHSSALGKVLLAYAPEEVRAGLIAELDRAGLAATTPSTITSVPALVAELEAVRSAGLALDREESLPGVFCLAAPVWDAAGKSVAAVSVAAPVGTFADGGHREQVAGMVRRTAAAIAYNLGWRGGGEEAWAVAVNGEARAAGGEAGVTDGKARAAAGGGGEAGRAAGAGAWKREPRPRERG